MADHGNQQVSETVAPTETDHDVPNVDASREANITAWTARIKAARKHWGPVFNRMRADMRFARLGADAEQLAHPDYYIANIVQRHVNRRVAALYARNPKAIARRRKRREFKVWDGNPMNIQLAIDTLRQDPTNMMALALVKDIAEAENRRIMIKRLSETLELTYAHYTNDVEPSFKKQLKQLVRRTIITGVGYVKMGFVRAMQLRPELELQVAEIAAKLGEIERINQNLNRGDSVLHDEEAERLRILIQSIESEDQEIINEGLAWSFPKSTHVIPDVDTVQLQGWIGTNWLAEEFTMTPNKVQQIYGVDIKGQYMKHMPNTAGRVGETGKKDMAVVWKVQDKVTGTNFVIVEGWPDYIEEPQPPEVHLERFFNIFSLTFNDIEDEDHIFPLSDVELIRPMQVEYNRSRQGLREHRAANRPKFATGKGKLSDEDRAALKTNQTNAIIELQGLQPGDDVNKLIQKFQNHNIDPALYDTSDVFADILRVSGSQEANMGPTSGDTATEVSIAETARLSDQSSNVDDLDGLLSELARNGGAILLQEMSVESVTRIVGPGAVWPQLSRQDIADELHLEIEAGSSGRPNAAVDMAKLERVAPTLLQIPGVSPLWFARHVLETLDANIDIDEALLENIPSIIAQNQLQGNPQPAQGDPKKDPGSQGGRGGEVNSPKQTRSSQGPQPGNPDPGAPAVAAG